MITERTEDQVQKTDESPTLDRRGMLTAMAVTAAGIVGAAALPSTALAVGTPSDGTGTDPGVWGRNLNTGGGLGVKGEAVSGDGVVGYSSGNTKSGVYGSNMAGVGGIGVTGDGAVKGVHGRTTVGIGVHGESTSGTALLVSGKAQFSRSGVTTFPKKKNYITVTVPGGLTTGVTKIFATMQGSPGDGVWIAYASKSSAATIKIRLNKKSTKKTTVAWWVID
jgi:hypothetical protein